ncbi:MAG: rhamnan synthesis F family protein [Treponema sp.]|nr:rhamnan synthesis F family protein [Treponema sp.]
MWFRPKALARLFEADWKRGDFLGSVAPESTARLESLNQAIRRSFGYVAQRAGYYSGWLMSGGYTPLDEKDAWRVSAVAAPPPQI